MDPTLPDHARLTPDKPAYIMASSGVVVTYAELEAASNRCAHLLRRLGLEPGDGIAIYLENHPRFLEMCWAATRAGLYYTTISTHLTASEVDYIVGDCRARVFLTSAARAEVAGGLLALLPGVEHRFMVDGAIDGYESFETAVAGLPATPIADEVQGADMLYSSGTTGRPKGIKRVLHGAPFGERESAFVLIAGLYGLDRDAVYLSPAPLYHAAPLRFNMTLIGLGATSVIMERFDAEDSLRLIARHAVTHSQWVPTMFVRMLKLPEAARRAHDLSSHRVAVHAAAPCPVQVKDAMIAWWGPILHEYYAGTEGNGYCAITSPEWLQRKGSVGKALIGTVRITDDAGTELAPGEPGTIYFADGRAFEYHNDPEQTARAYNARGWSTLGDIGYVDTDGFLYLTDRKAHTIISGGVNIYPQEIENLLVTHPRVLDVAVIGVPSEEFGEEVKAVVQPIDEHWAGPELAHELLDFCRGQLADLKIPRSVDFVDELPRQPTGKLYKRLLKDRYWGRRDSRIV
jgi:long-chain acyl-CoA synthetase